MDSNKQLLESLLSTAQDLNVDITIDTGKSEKERQEDMEAAIEDIINITEKLLGIRSMDEADKFEYLGYHFIPIKKLTDGESTLEQINKCTISDTELGFSVYDWKKNNYTYAGFIKAAGKDEYDLFKCEENGKVYMPCENELYQYIQ